MEQGNGNRNILGVDTVHYNTVQYSTIQYSTIQYSTVQYSTIQYITIQYSTVQYNTIQYNTVQYSTIQYITIQLYITVLTLPGEENEQGWSGRGGSQCADAKKERRQVQYSPVLYCTV